MVEIYKHYKGKLYQKLYEARDCENSEKIVVVYQQLYGEYGIWIRDKNDFEAILLDGRKRFELVKSS